MKVSLNSGREWKTEITNILRPSTDFRVFNGRNTRTTLNELSLNEISELNIHVMKTCKMIKKSIMFQ